MVTFSLGYFLKIFSFIVKFFRCFLPLEEVAYGWLVGWSYMIIAELAELAIFLTPRSAKVAGVWG